MRIWQRIWHKILEKRIGPGSRIVNLLTDLILFFDLTKYSGVVGNLTPQRKAHIPEKRPDGYLAMDRHAIVEIRGVSVLRNAPHFK